ncbi:MAG: hypothetical protein NWE89_14935 [Candidatus Bathyarchaeota archaeon]|nr:hypothetical protein [Candidatus Bathyarchaeota archaeon]
MTGKPRSKVFVMLMLATLITSALTSNFAYATDNTAWLSSDGSGTATLDDASFPDPVISLTAPGQASWNTETGMGEDVSEGRLVIALPENTTLGEIESISWQVYTAVGYPPHADLILDLDGDGVYDGGHKDIVTGGELAGVDDVLVFEYAYQPYVGPGYMYNSPGVPYGHYDPALQTSFYNPLCDVWVSTFQNSDSESNTEMINDDSIGWLYSGLPGPYSGGVFGTLEDFKTGTASIDVDSDTIVLEIHIEVDNWLGATEAYVDDIKVNDEMIIGVDPPQLSILSPEAATYTQGDVPLEITAWDIFGLDSITYNVEDSSGPLFTEAQEYTGPSSMSGLAPGEYTLTAWAVNTLGLSSETSVTFQVIASGISVDVYPETLNLRSGGRWITVKISVPVPLPEGEFDVSTLKLWVNGESVDAEWFSVGDNCVMIKFDRSQVQVLGEVGEEIEVTVTGELPNGEEFEGTDTIRMINPGNPAKPKTVQSQNRGQSSNGKGPKVSNRGNSSSKRNGPKNQ